MTWLISSTPRTPTGRTEEKMVKAPWLLKASQAKIPPIPCVHVSPEFILFVEFLFTLLRPFLSLSQIWQKRAAAMVMAEIPATRV